jgi:hypothetical protein
METKRVIGRRALTIAAAAIPALAASPAWAHDPGLGRCLAMPDRDARLACYDNIARAEQGAAATGAPPTRADAVASAPAAPAATLPSPREEFGFGAAEREQRRAEPQRQIDEVAMRVKEAREVGAGYWQFVMDDGSIWRLAEVRRSFRAPRPNEEVRIERASLGSYLLLFRNQPSMRIKRIQ